MKSPKIQKPQRIIKLSETQNMLSKIATAMIKYHGAYYCMIDGEKVKVVQ